MAQAQKRKGPKNKARRLSVQGDKLQFEALGDKLKLNSEEKAEQGDVEPPFKHLALYSQAGYNPWNPNKVNQDRVIGEVGVLGDRTAVMGAFDGHGQHGEYVSQYLISNLPKFVAKAAENDGFLNDPVEGMRAMGDKLEEALEASVQDPEFLAFSGSTGVFCFIKDKTVWTANVGDSRSIIGRDDGKDGFEILELSIDQKPDDPAEQERIENSGGRVKALSPDPMADEDDDFEEPVRVWLQTENIPGLAMSRSFGDTIVKPVGVIATPEVTVHQITDKDRCMIMGSDGVWDFVPNTEAVKLVMSTMAKTGDPKACAKLLVETAVSRWEQYEEVVDDISVSVCFF